MQSLVFKFCGITKLIREFNVASVTTEAKYFPCKKMKVLNKLYRTFPGKALPCWLGVGVAFGG